MLTTVRIIQHRISRCRVTDVSVIKAAIYIYNAFNTCITLPGRKEEPTRLKYIQVYSSSELLN